jgi:tRNA(Ile)-lysidine synthase
MDVQLEPGSYVVAVSGGVDSAALLHMLYVQKWAAEQAGQPAPKLIVAHFDHGIRDDSVSDREFVQALAKAYGLPFVYDEGHLGIGASEATARDARYDFLRRVQNASGSKSIITAHHQDDLLETAVMNLLRGTGRKGLTSLGSSSDVHRPVLHLPKQNLKDYALNTGLRWREDSTNDDQTYLRNYIRQNIIPRLDEDSRRRLLEILHNLKETNRELDIQLANQLHQQSQTGVIDRTWFNHLPHDVSKEVMAAWLRARGIRQFDSKGLERLVIAAKVASPGRIFPLNGGQRLHIGTKFLALMGSER